MSRTLPLARWIVSSFVLASMLALCAGRINGAMTAYLSTFAGTGLVTALVTNASQDDERREPGPAEIHHGSRLTASALFLATVIVSELDAGRFHWVQQMSKPTQITGLVVLISAAGLQVWAMAVNPFFSAAIRIQRDRGHRLVARGPYRFIRHPGYLGMMIMIPATALALSSPVALIPAFCYSALIMWRTKREDEFLTTRLVAYPDYAARVRCRLIPSLW